MAAKKAPATPKKTAVKKKPGRPSMADRAADMALKNIELEKLLAEVQDELSVVKETLEQKEKFLESAHRRNGTLAKELNEWRYQKQSATIESSPLWDWLIMVEEDWGDGKTLLAQVGVVDWRRCYGEDHGSHLAPFEERLSAAINAIHALYADYGEGEVNITVKEFRNCVNV
jgi:hypothetical protein